MSVAYYNECDPFAAAWLRELIADGLIAPGWVDERSIEDVRPDELKGFTQCHFFAGIGVWSLALRLAGWPDDRAIWTGSCPCQPFSAAGKGAGFADERHLWPGWYHLIEHGKRRDVVVVGEQVASKDGRAWFDLVSGDMQALGYACGAVDTSAASLGAPFIGQRLYWVGATSGARSQGHTGHGDGRGESGRIGAQQVGSVAASGAIGGLASSEASEWQRDRAEPIIQAEPAGFADRSDDHRLASSTSGQPRHGDLQSSGQYRFEPQNLCDSSNSRIPLHPTEYWRDADWLLCRDPNGVRFRPVEPPTQRMADARPLGRSVVDRSGTGQTHFPLCEKTEYVNRLNEVRGFGNALNVSQAVCFIETVMEYLDS